MALNNLSVKINFGDDMRRFALKEPVSFARLEELTRQLYCFDAARALTIRYADDEGELISVSSDAELEEAFAVSRALASKALKLTVSLVGGGGSNDGSAAAAAQLVSPSLSRASSFASSVFSYVEEAPVV